MSRVGKMPVTIPQGVTVTVDGGVIKVVGPKGNLEAPLLGGIKIVVEDGIAEVKRGNDEALQRARHGLMRAILANMVVGVSEGFEKKLEINGVGYRVLAQGSDLKFSLGFSHDIDYKLPDGVSAAVEQNVITISGIDRQKVGQSAAEIRALKKPEPYKGKGIKYQGEHILRKSGKSGKETA